MLTFKQFLNAQDDNIDDMEAVKKYQEYKLEFRKTQLGDFFQQHKEEEWYVFHLCYVSLKTVDSNSIHWLSCSFDLSYSLDRCMETSDTFICLFIYTRVYFCFVLSTDMLYYIAQDSIECIMISKIHWHNINFYCNVVAHM